MQWIDRITVSRRTVIVTIYQLFMMYFLFKSYFYMVYMGGFPDEIVHISYIAAVETQNTVVPDFKDMKILAQQVAPSEKNNLSEKVGYGGIYVFTNAVNYLGHPPLYYQAMRLSQGIEVHKNADGTYYYVIHILRLRCFSLLLAAIAMLIFFYVGYKKLGPSPFVHLLYAAVAVSVPMLCYDAAGVNNDTMSLLAVAVFVLGMMRFFENKRNVQTYFIIALGVCASFLSKLTTGFIVTAALCFICLDLLVRERNLRFLLTPQFIFSAPLYVFTAGYFAAVKLQTGTIMPQINNLNYQQYLTSGFFIPPDQRPALNLKTYGVSHVDLSAYANYYWNNFALTWTGIWSHSSLIKDSLGLFSVYQVGLLALWVLPLLALVLFITHRRYPEIALYLGGYFGTVFAALYQFNREYHAFQYVSGYTGGWQSRYYLCFVPLLSMAIAAGMGWFYNKGPLAALRNRRLAGGLCLVRRSVISLLCLSFSLLLMYEDFGYFILTFRKYQ